MAGVAVARLRLKTPPDRAALAAHRVTEALRLAPAPSERLLLVRRLALGRLPVSARSTHWEARTADALAEQSSRAVHGGEAGPDAGAVWFRSVSEARALLLRRLATGRRPTAWFWRLAVPEWENLPLETWLPRWIALAEREPPEAAALARAVVVVAEAGELPRLIAALSVGSSSPLGSAALDWAQVAGASDPRRVVLPVEAPLGPAAARRAAETLARLPPTARAAVVAALIEERSDPEIATWLARAVLLAQAPELGFAREILADAAEAVVRQARSPTPTTSLLETPHAAPAQPPPDMPEQRRDQRRPLPETSAPSGQARTPQAVNDPATPMAPPATTLDAPPSPFPFAEQTSRLAGLFLLIRPLARMGFIDWLAARPEAAADGFARGLLRAVARRMGAAEDDPALLAITGEDDPAWADDLAAWRVGLDRWLRRTARLRLHDVVRRRGGLLLTEDVLEVRYPLEAADVRLRRRALDIDPNWTPWLGLSVRYHYRDEPLR